MELTKQQTKELQAATMSADLRTVFFVALMSDKKTAENFGGAVRAIDEDNLEVLADFIDNPSAEAQKEAINIFKMIKPEERGHALCIQNSKDNTVLHLVRNDKTRLALLEMLYPPEGDCAMFVPNYNGMSSFDLMSPDAKSEAKKMILKGYDIPSKRVESSADIVKRIFARKAGEKTRD